MIFTTSALVSENCASQIYHFETTCSVVSMNAGKWPEISRVPSVDNSLFEPFLCKGRNFAPYETRAVPLFAILRGSKEAPLALYQPSSGTSTTHIRN